MQRFRTLLDAPGKDVLTTQLRRLYDGNLSFPAAKGRPYIIGNFVSTLDGVVSFHIRGRSGGGEISGFNKNDQFVMGLLRALSDAVVMGSGTLNSGSGDAYVPAVISPPHKKEFAALRKRLRKPSEPLNVFLSESGTIDLSKPVFRHKGLTTIVLTTKRGERNLRRMHGQELRRTTVVSMDSLAPKNVAQVLFKKFDVQLLLHEGGPTVFGQFIKEKLIDEMFLTLAPQVAGRDMRAPRLSFAAEVSFSPETAPWQRLKSVKMAGDHLFLCYSSK